MRSTRETAPKNMEIEVADMQSEELNAVGCSVAAIEAETPLIVWPDGEPDGRPLGDMLHRQVPFLPHVRKARIVRSERRQFRVYDGGLTKADEENRDAPARPDQFFGPPRR